jgi:hypothetical protein
MMLYTPHLKDSFPFPSLLGASTQEALLRGR